MKALLMLCCRLFLLPWRSLLKWTRIMCAVCFVTRMVSSRKRITAAVVTVFGVILLSAGIFIATHLRMSKEEILEQQLVQLQLHMDYLQSLYYTRQEDIYNLKSKIIHCKGNISHTPTYEVHSVTLSPQATALLRNMSGMMAAKGVSSAHARTLRLPLMYHTLPHLLLDPRSLRPAYHLHGPYRQANVVIGIPTVKRDKESYLMITLTHVVGGLSHEDFNSTLIVVLVGEADMLYVLDTARQIETMFPKEVKSGLIEVLSPAASFYPDLDKLKPTLGDPIKRVKWRTKQNLDIMYLMAYAHSKAPYYLMLEDDIIAKKNYLKDIRSYIERLSVSNPHWILVEFCRVGGIGKLFKSVHLMPFITYIQLFYDNMPIDWLVESFIADKVCTIEKTTELCTKNRLTVRPRYNKSLFQHIGLYSSLKGKIQKIKDTKYGALPSHYPHSNPPVRRLYTDIESYFEHSLRGAYEGTTYFWGMKPKRGDVVEFKFVKPLQIQKYLFRSGNVEHVSDRFYSTVVEVRTPKSGNTYRRIGSFDEFGLAEGNLTKLGPITAIRLRVLRPSSYWVILSEIYLKPLKEVANS